MRVLLVLGLAALAAAAPKKLSSKFLSTPMVRGKISCVHRKNI